MDSDRIKDVLEILPHRPPFLFVTRILSLEAGHFAVAEYDIPPDLYILRGHFPQRPVLPGVIILEMMAQSGALALLGEAGKEGHIPYLAGIDKARFRRPVEGGETLRAEVKLERVLRGIGRAQGKAYVLDEEVASATIMFALSAE